MNNETITEEYYCIHCGAVLNKQEGFDPNLSRWFCTECGQLLLNEDPDEDVLYPGVTWYCDGCNDVLNEQEGFSDDCGEWTCTKCGYVNKISEDEIWDTAAEVEHIEMTGDIEKDSLLLSRLFGEKVHIVCKDGIEFFGLVCNYIDIGENMNDLPYILLEEDLDDMPFELYANDIAYVDVIRSYTRHWWLKEKRLSHNDS